MKYSHRKTLIKQFIEEKLTPKNIIKAAIIVVVVIAFLVVINMLQSPKASHTSFYDKDIIYVGLSPDSALADKTDNEFSGFERDVAETLLKRIYGENKRVEFVEINSQNASYMLKNGDIDLALCMFASGVTKTRGTLLTDPYYYDNNLVVVRNDGTVSEISDLAGKNIDVMSTEIYLTDIRGKLKGLGVSDADTVAKGCTSYPDAIDALKAGRTDAVIAGELKLKNYVTADLKSIGKVGTTGYCVMAWTTESEFVLVANEQLAQMNRDGTLNELKSKWGLS